VIPEQLQRILLIDDETEILETCRHSLRSCGFSDVLTVSDSRTVMGLLAREEVTVIVLDLSMPHLSGLELLPRIVSQYPQIPVILATANNQKITKGRRSSTASREEPSISW